MNLPQAQTVDINKDSPPNVTGMMEYLEMEGVRSLGTYVNNYIIGAEFTADQNETNATAFFNNQGFHTCALALGAIQVRSFLIKKKKKFFFFLFLNILRVNPGLLTLHYCVYCLYRHTDSSFVNSIVSLKARNAFHHGH